MADPFHGVIVTFPKYAFGVCREPGCETTAKNFVLVDDKRIGPWCAKHAKKKQASVRGEP